MGDSMRTTDFSRAPDFGRAGAQFVGGTRFTDGGEEVRACLEAILVEVVPRATAGTEQKVALVVRVLAEPGSELVAILPTTLRRSLAIGSSRWESGESASSEIIEPSSK